MTDQEYIERNLQGYEGDYFVGQELEKLCEQHNVIRIIETGTFIGGTTIQLSKLRPVYTIEINEEYFLKAKENIKNLQPVNHCDITQYFGDTVEVLKVIVPDAINGRTLFYLDAHWYNYCPLLEELEIISRDLKSDLKPVIVIHDFQVPERFDLGYDEYNGQPFNFSWIKSRLDSIYGEDNYDYHYNTENATGAKRGLIYIYPKIEQK
jgi:hypothetical protein